MEQIVRALESFGTKIRLINKSAIMIRISIIICITIFAAPCLSQDLEQAMDSLMSGYVESAQLHGSVTYVQQGDEILHLKAYGFNNVAQNQKMRQDDIFRIASMSKVITAAGALKLYEEGRFLLDDPVKNYLPQLSNLKVMENPGTDSARKVKLERDITIRDLFRHTAGFGYAYQESEDNDTIDKLYISKELSTSYQTADDFLRKLAEIPLKYQPGSKWEYSYSIDVLGFLIEKISGQNLHDYLTESLFTPLEMTSTGFYVSKENVNRLTGNYIYKDDQLELIDDPTKSEYLEIPTIYSGGGGLKDNVGGIVTTASDFANFCKMLLNYGMFKGKVILNRQTVELMISNQIEGIEDRSFPVGAYGFGVGVVPDIHYGRTQVISWLGGPYNTGFLINFNTGLIAVFLTQNSPWMHLNIVNKFFVVMSENMP